MLADLQLILRRGVDDPAQLGESIRRFLTAYDSVPDEMIASGDASWDALERLAYELRYYAPDEASDETLLNDQQAREHIREALGETS
jgi:hypothetical protein